MATWLVAAAILFGVLSIHPFTTFPLTLWLARQVRGRLRVRPDGGRQDLSVALCFCAYNEAAIIPQKIENLRRLKAAMPSLKIHVYVDGSVDGTGELLSAVPDLVDLVWSRQRFGKTHGMNQLVARADADIIVFTDANVMLDPAALANMGRYFGDPEVGCVCGQLVYVDDETATASIGSLYWRLEEEIKQLESDTGSVMGADGSIFAIRRSLHHAAPSSIIDDMFVSFSILLEGYRIVRAPDVVAYERSVSSTSEEFRRKIRIACQAFNVHRLLWPRIRTLSSWNQYKYVSHKLLRWFSIFSLSLSAICFTAWLVLSGWVVLAALGWLSLIAVMVLGAGFQIRPFSLAANVIVALAGTGFGVIESLRGQRFQTWTPASSIRQS